eukprot:3859159-Rhodomonas_salina.2
MSVPVIACRHTFRQYRVVPGWPQQMSGGDRHRPQPAPTAGGAVPSSSKRSLSTAHRMPPAQHDRHNATPKPLSA